MSNGTDLDGLELGRVLSSMYQAQKCTFFLENMMGRVMDELDMSDEQAITVIKILIQRRYLATSSFLPVTFLNSKYIRSFPVVLSTKAIRFLKAADGGN